MGPPLPSNDLWQDPPSCVDEPFANLLLRELRFVCEDYRFGTSWVGVVPVLVKPLSQNKMVCLDPSALVFFGHVKLQRGTSSCAEVHLS